MLPHALSSDACSLVPGEERAAVTVELELRGASVDARRLLPLADPLGRAPGLRARRSHLRRRRAAPPSRGAEPLRGRARGRGARCERKRERSGALVVDSEEPEFDFDEHGNVSDDRARASQTESHRLIEHLMIAANEAVARAARRARRAVPVPRARAPRARAHRAPGRPARLARGADAAAARAHVRRRRPPSCWARSPGASSEHVRRTGRGRMRARLARAALAQAGLLLARQPRPRGPALERATAISPRRSAAIPISSATARCSRRSAAASARRAPASWRSSARGPPNASARR